MNKKKGNSWIQIQFHNLSKEQLEHLFKAESELLNAGVHFDTGYDFVDKRRDWEFDWSLRGATVKIKETKELKEIE